MQSHILMNIIMSKKVFLYSGLNLSLRYDRHDCWQHSRKIKSFYDQPSGSELLCDNSPMPLRTYDPRKNIAVEAVPNKTLLTEIEGRQSYEKFDIHRDSLSFAFRAVL